MVQRVKRHPSQREPCEQRTTKVDVWHVSERWCVADCSWGVVGSAAGRGWPSGWHRVVMELEALPRHLWYL